jgi:16S rRNA (guanine527-N7)-methyltransferase
VGWWECLSDERIERWLQKLVTTPGLTSVRDVEEARRVHLDGSLAAAPLVEHGPVVDVGSGGGSPGIPLAAARPDLDFHLLESSRKKCAFLEEIATDFANVEVVCARAEEHAAAAGRDAYATAVSRALAPPPVAAEWCLPLVAPGGKALLFVGPSAVAGLVARVAEQLGAEGPEQADGLFVLRKVQPTPEGFPRRPGMAKKRPLA